MNIERNGYLLRQAFYSFFFLLTNEGLNFQAVEKVAKT